MNPEKIRNDFLVLNQKKPPIYFDNACMTLKPRQVTDKIMEYYNEYPACGGRSNHRLSRKVTEEVLRSRRIISDFFNTKKTEEIIFTRNTTEGINLVANSIKKGDKVLCSGKEHNSNLVPWLVRKDAVHKTFRFNDIEDFNAKIKNTKLVSIVHVSNVDGTSNNVKEMIKIAHENDAIVLVDAAQSAPSREIDVRKLDVDLMVCSGHKMLGPTGTGILYGKMEVLEQLSQFIVGGDTVKNTQYDSFEQEGIPERFEAGLQDYANLIGLGEAVRYLKKAGRSDIEKHETRLNEKITEAFNRLGIDIIGPKEPEQRAGIISFNVGKMNHHDVALMLDSNNIMIRSGMHCAHSWFNANNVQGSARASLYLYNNEEEVDFFLEKIEKIVKIGK
ncbi:cysteine desulfurase [Candidatus Woesearchaeota archaeon]|nr:cysteine desulfurase [Candidatus Woesearchaeota archaeon]